jgi:hypothetical protein
LAESTCDLEYNKKEYAIVNDNVFFSYDYDNGIPPWLEDYIKNLTYTTMYELYAGYSGGLGDALGLSSIFAPGVNIFDISTNLLNALRSLEVAKNDYKFYVDKKITDDMAYVATLETLNANIGNNDATIKDLQVTYADKYSAASEQISLLTAKTDNSNAEIANVKGAIATQTGALAQRIDSLVTNYTDQNSKLTSTATAVQQLETYTGVMNDKLTAQAQYITTLDATLTDVNGRKLTEVGNTTGQLVKTEINNATGQIQAYSLYSNVNQININGIRYVDGFGMYSGLVKPDPNDSSKNYIYDSEFWVSADKFMIYDRSSLSNPSNVVYEDVVVYNPKTQQNETKRLIKEIKNAKPVFGVNTVTREVEINGNLVVDGTITTNEIAQNSVGNLVSNGYVYYSGTADIGAVDIASIQIPPTNVSTNVYGAVLLEFTAYIDSTNATVTLYSGYGTSSPLVDQTYTALFDSVGNALNMIGGISIRNIQPYHMATSPVYRVEVTVGGTGMNTHGIIRNYILTGTVIKR